MTEQPIANNLMRYGDRAFLIELDSAANVLAVRQQLLAAQHPAISAVVPAARTVLVEADARLTEADLRQLLSQPPPPKEPTTSEAKTVELAVTYDGPDLAAVARLIGESERDVIHRHTQAEYTVQFCGFSAGFSYLIGGDPALSIPRLDRPRTHVPAGSVAIASEYTGIYPRSSPGGWRILGHTDAVLFDLEREPPALLTPGTQVRLRAR